MLRRGELALDRARRRASRNGQLVPLTSKELGVLEVLMSADGAVISAGQLLEQAWDEFADPFTNAVAVTVMRLRRKLGDPPLIETVTGGRVPAAMTGAPAPRRPRRSSVRARIAAACAGLFLVLGGVLIGFTYAQVGHVSQQVPGRISYRLGEFRVGATEQAAATGASSWCTPWPG